MARTRTYNHFCPVARSLEVIGEKWSLLIVRDLLRGPQRFTDLLRGLNNITPKWLTLRLRELESAGIVERDQEPGRKEVRYRLTEKGAQLGPVIAALNVWGVDHAMRPPEPGEGILLARSLQAIASYFNSRGLKAEAPLEWEIRTPDNPPARIRFDGETWRLRGEDPPRRPRSWWKATRRRGPSSWRRAARIGRRCSRACGWPAATTPLRSSGRRSASPWAPEPPAPPPAHGYGVPLSPFSFLLSPLHTRPRDQSKARSVQVRCAGWKCPVTARRYGCATRAAYPPNPSRRSGRQSSR